MSDKRRTLIVDNYDSFTYNLVQYLGELGAEPTVVRNDEASVDDLLAGGHERVVVSPGPCTPAEAGISAEAIRRFAEQGIPVLGVCLGHQALAVAFDGEVVRGEPVHGKTAEVEHDGRTIFRGLESPVVAGRYHSLVVAPDVPAELEVSARTGDTVMALRHRELPAEGVQFHPESVLTGEGKALLRNFLAPPETRVELIRRSLEIWNCGELERSCRLISSPDIVLVPMSDWPESEPVSGLDNVIEFWRQTVEPFEGDTITADVEAIDELPNDCVVIRLRWRQAGSSSGAEAEVVLWTLQRWRGGSVHRQEWFDSEATALAAAGE